MRTQLLHTTFLVMTMFVIQTYTMEQSVIISTQVLTKSAKYQLDTYKQSDISDDNREKKDLLKTVINNNNLTLTTPLLDGAQKEKFALQNTIRTELNNSTSQDSIIIIDRLEQDINTTVVKEYREKICPRKCIFHCILTSGAVITIGCLIGGFTYYITANPCIISSCIG